MMSVDLRSYTVINTARSLGLIALEYFVIGAAIGWAYQPASGWPVILLAWLLVGSRMRALNNLCHEGSHGLLSTNRRFNKILMALVSYPIFISPPAYIASHHVHHQRLGYDDDPDWVRYRQLGIDRLPCAMSWSALPGQLLRTYRDYMRGIHWSSLSFRGQRNWRLMSSWAMVAALLTLYGAWQMWALFWLVPYLTSFQLIRFVGELSEHGGLYQRVPATTNLALKAVAVSRNMVLHPILTFLIYPHGGGLHVLHHRYPGIPGPCLGRLHKALETENAYQHMGQVQITRRLIFSSGASVSLWDTLRGASLSATKPPL